MDRTCACLLTLALAGVGCAGEGADAGFGSPPPAAEQPTGPSGDGDGAERAIAEADIVQLDGDRLYALSEGGTLSVIDVGELGQLLLLGQTELPGVPFEMYLRGDTLLTLVDRAVTAQGSFAYGPQATDPNAGAMVLAVDVSEPERMDLGLPLSIQGAIADSRVVGDVLYLATYEDTACYGCDGEPKTLVTSFDVSDESDIREVDQLSFGSNAPDGYNLPWGSNWTRSIYVNQERLYIGGHAEIEPGQLYDNTSEPEGIIDVIDVTDPTGRMREGARIEVAGAILSRWQLDERDGILRVVSQRGAGRTGNGIGSPEVATFAVESTDTFTPLGNTSLVLPRQEGLRAVRFDDDRAYAITYNQTDPLFVIDLSEPELPVQRGELHMPGFVFHMEPFGDRVLGIGLDRDDPQGSLNVSLFDVSNPDAPTMIERIGFGPNNLWEDYQILEQVMAEDQDRIQKAFRVLSGGRIVAP
ncbi:MAG: beta-propeller domain-containing protein, partial [Deltaproteobacteria bacterium]|nr:beta-propeller domain-containing protein [Deltaproteobacteria bacterium]